jgi:hypothetical protein
MHLFCIITAGLALYLVIAGDLISFTLDTDSLGLQNRKSAFGGQLPYKSNPLDSHHFV